MSAISLEDNGGVGEIVWLFGQGLSIDCCLSWDVCVHCPEVLRDEKIECIRTKLRAAMDAHGVNPNPIRHFLRFLSERTQERWRHLFLTTNWDFLLQREIDKVVRDFVPRWLRDSQVFHVNGTVEALADNSRRSPFLLPENSAQERTRTWSVEFSTALSHMEWASTFVVVGMSFECKADRALLALLNRVKEMLPSGESDWILVNPDQAALDCTRDQIQRNLPRASVRGVLDTFTRWREAGFPELKKKGVFRE